MKNSNYHSLKMQQYPKLLRRPLPPTLPKLPVCKKKTHTAKTGDTKRPHVKFTQDETTSTDIISRRESQAPDSTQNIFSDHPGQEKVATMPVPLKSTNSVHWKTSDTTTGSMFLPSFHLPSTRAFKKESDQMESSQKFSTKLRKRQKTQADEKLRDILILSSGFSKSSCTPLVISEEPPEHQPLPESPDTTDEVNPPLRDLSAPLLGPIPSSISTKTETRQSRQYPPDVAMVSKVVVHIAQFPGPTSLPTPKLPRKPRRQTMIETIMAENGKSEIIPKLHEGLIRNRKIEPGAIILRGEGFKTIVATQYDTLIALTNLAIINCQIYGRNALNLKGFFILQCPDLTCLALQLVYLNLSYNHLSQFPTEIFCLKNLQVLSLRNNPIKEIPLEIQQLKYLRIFSIAFNYISDLPLGFSSLSYLEELDLSYNELTFVPSEIQKLRSLEKLNIDGNYLTSFPPGILLLNLTKIHFENTFTHHSLWAESSSNNPQRLSQICCLVIVKNNLYKSYKVIPKIVRKLLKSTSKCDWCHGPKFGEGMRIIRSCDIFGASQLPIMFHACSPSCWKEIKEVDFVLGGFPSRRISLNVD